MVQTILKNRKFWEQERYMINREKNLDQNQTRSELSAENGKPGSLAVMIDHIKNILRAPTHAPLTEAEIAATLAQLPPKQDESENGISGPKFIAEAMRCGIRVLTLVPEGGIIEQDGPMIVLQNIGKNAQVTLHNGSLIVLGDVEYGAMLETRQGKSAKTDASITVAGTIGHHVRLTSAGNIIISSAGDFVQLRASHIIKAGDIGQGANIMAQQQIELGEVGEDLRSTHFAALFTARNIGDRAIIKAGNIAVGNVGGGSELVASFGIEAGAVGENCSFTARTILVQSSAPGCELYSALSMNDLSQKRTAYIS